MDQAPGCLIAFGALVVLGACGWVIQQLRRALGTLADPGFFLLVSIAALGLLFAHSTIFAKSAEKQGLRPRAIQIAVFAGFILSGAFVGCLPGGKHSSARIGDDDVISVTVGGVLGLVLGVIVFVGVTAFLDVASAAGRRTVVTVVSVCAGVGALWRAQVALANYVSPDTHASTSSSSSSSYESRDASADGHPHDDGRALRRRARLASVRPTKLVPIYGGTLHPSEDSDPVKVAPFAIDDVEVSQGAYLACVESKACEAKDLWKPEDIDPISDHDLALPMTGLAFSDAATYCTRMGKRLPTSNEWLFAAFGSDSVDYPWGRSEASDVCWRGYAACAVGASAGDVTPEGVHDLGFNVSEWVRGTGGSTPTVLGGNYRSNGAREIKQPKTVTAGFQWTATGFRCAADHV